jgi:S1-C subfamily serine protease
MYSENSFLETLRKKKFLSLALVLVLGGMFYFKRGSDQVDIYDNKDLKSRSVKIVNFGKRSGGSGSIITSNHRESTVLTNSHVCEVVESGGLVITDKGEYAVTSYRKSERHDLCLITVGADLGVNTNIAKKAPDNQEEAAISGHPRLLPNVITRGHFSGKEIIKILTAIRTCTEEDFKSDNMLLCLFLGGIPTVTAYEAQLVTALIQGGSSGSPVYNSNGEIAAVAFAGAGEMSQAYVVPFEAVSTFFEEELKTLKKQFPKMSQEIKARDLIRGRGMSVSKEMLITMCNRPEAKGEIYKDVCSISAIRGDLTWKH